MDDRDAAPCPACRQFVAMDEPLAGNVELELENADSDAQRVRFELE